MQLPKISIVTPSFNQGKYIEQTILSVLNQDYPNLEYIIMDGGSTDETVEIIKKYESRITYWESEKDQGQTDAINKGFARCTGDIFNWINSDDYYEPGALLKVGETFLKNSSTNIVAGKEWAFNDEKPEEKILNPGTIIRNNVYETIQTGIIDQPCTFFRKKVIEDFFPLDISLRYVMDRLLWWRYLLKFGQENIVRTNDVLTNFRMHTLSKSINEGDLFENEFNRLKLSLFETLEAPEILMQQIEKVIPPFHCKWQINIKPRNYILAEFATYFAERHYVHDELEVTAMLMRLVKKWKGVSMTKKETKLWLGSDVIPKSVLIRLKKIKNITNFS